MANEKKLTKREKFEMIAKIEAVSSNSILAEFVEHELELLAKKNASGSNGEKKLTPTQIANKGIAKAIFDYLKESGKSLTISAMIKEIPTCADLSNQKINGILMREYNSEKYPNANPLFVRTEEKGVAKFKVNPNYIAE